MSSTTSGTGGPVDSVESVDGSAGRHESPSAAHDGSAECGTAAACGACSLAGGGGCGTVPDGGAPQGTAEPTAPVGCGAAAPAPVLTWREKVSERLAVLPPAVLAPVIVGAVAIGLVLTGALGLVLVALGVLALLGLFALTWPRLTTPEKALRIAVLVFVLGVAVIRFVPS